MWPLKCYTLKCQWKPVSPDLRIKEHVSRRFVKICWRPANLTTLIRNCITYFCLESCEGLKGSYKTGSMRVSFHICIGGMYYKFKIAFFGKHFAWKCTIFVLCDTGQQMLAKKYLEVLHGEFHLQFLSRSTCWVALPTWKKITVSQYLKIFAGNYRRCMWFFRIFNELSELSVNLNIL